MARASVVQWPEMRVSVRVLWPFMRIVESSPTLTTTRLLAGAGIEASALARPDTRIPHALAIEALRLDRATLDQPLPSANARMRETLRGPRA